jgi:hypothetical protein
LGAFALVIVGVLPASADVIDFETQAASAGNFITAADPALTIGPATFTGGQLLQSELGLPADQTGVYATAVFGIGEINPLTIDFSIPVNGFSVVVANGGAAQNYTVTSNVGDVVTKSLPVAGAGGAATFALSGTDISTVSIAASTPGISAGWNFAVDNVTFTPAPEPGSGWLLLVVWAGVALRIPKRRDPVGQQPTPR